MAIDLDELLRFVETVLTANKGDHFTTLGICPEYVEHHHVGVSMPYREALIGDPDTGVIHGGAITALLDTCCGFAAATALDDLAMTPTIDLRIDYMCAATPGKTVYADAEVYRVTESVIFARAAAHHGDRQRPIATAIGNFFRMDSELFTDMRREFRAAQAAKIEGGNRG
ncbi:PaaI family thioesterase [Zhongshania guokunii]|uniref:PaaI family thioesterase n=1 Tax=Zhongshania guokunii TaxID=641783 RepID=A0ABV3UAD8_9GAMM